MRPADGKRIQALIYGFAQTAFEEELKVHGVGAKETKGKGKA